MKERKTLRKFYSQHEGAIQGAIWAVLVIALFIGGYLVSWNFLFNPFNDSQLEACEQVARDVYAQKGTVIVEVPEGFVVEMTTTTITVLPNDFFHRGKVIAKLQNGELVMTRDMGYGGAVFMSLVIGGFSVWITLIALGVVAETVRRIYKKIKTRSEK